MATFTFNTTRHPRSGKRERLTVSNTAIGITEAVRLYTASGGASEGQFIGKLRKEASAAVLQVLTEGINWTIDGSTPTLTADGTPVGFNSNAGDFIYLDTPQMVKAFKAIREAGADSAVEVVALFPM